jgi:hypothetical protein
LYAAWSDGSVSRIPVQLGDDGAISMTNIEIIHPADNKHVTALEVTKVNPMSLCSQQDLVIWTKAGIVQIASLDQDSPKTSTVTLKHIGDWANANAFNPCAGIALKGEDSLLITLANLTQHVINDIHSSPRLDIEASTKYTAACRDIFVGQINEKMAIRKKRLSDTEEQALSSLVTGFEAIGSDASIYCFAAE